MNNVPVFVFHMGNPPYLKQTIELAERNNEVHLLGDESNKDACKIWKNASDYVSDDYEVFEKVFIQMSDYSLTFDLNCFKRFFIMRTYMNVHHIDKMLFADSDLLLYENISEFYARNICKASLSIPERQEDYRWTAQAHCSFWTIEYLSDFLTFVTETYSSNISLLQQKYEHHLKNGIKGGVCDMTLLYLWSKEKKDILNTAVEHEGVVFDHCIGDAGNYWDKEYKYSKILASKVVKYIDDVPFCINKDGKKVKMASLHCQGASKALIVHLLRKKPNAFAAYFDRYCEIGRRIILKIGRKNR